MSRSPADLVLLPTGSSIHVPDGLRVLHRPSDWAMTPARRLLSLVIWSLRASWESRQAQRVVVVTAGLELFVLAFLLRRKQVTAVDWLVPRTGKLDRRALLRRVAFVVIRRADGDILTRRFGIEAGRVTFAHLPAPPPQPATDGDYLYAAGWAHRDWPTLLAAQRLCGLPLKIAASLESDQPGVEVLGPLSPEDGRQVMKGARIVVLPFLATDLPSGPLVLLDAMAHGKAIVVTDVSGSRDYVVDGVTALVVPPSDPVLLAASAMRLWEDEPMRRSLGAAAQRACDAWSVGAFWATVLASGTST